MGLTEEQHAAATDPHNRVVVLASPGSGKTATLAARVKGIVGDARIPGTRAVAITFTNRAAAELEQRTGGMAEASTLHGLCSRLKRLSSEPPFTIYDDVDSQDVAIYAGLELGILVEGRFKDRRRAASKVLGDPRGGQRYRRLLRQYRAVDYDLLEQDGIRHAGEEWAVWAFSNAQFLVDESQDTSPAQWELLRALLPRSIFVCGDVKQTIYSWRGASPDRMLQAWKLGDPEREGGPVWSRHALTMNFRSVPGIVDAANVIAEGMAVPAPPMRAHRPANARPVSLITVDSKSAEAEAVANVAADVAVGFESGPPRMLVLARRWRSLNAVDQALKARGIPYLHLGERSSYWQSEPIKAALRAASIWFNPHNDLWARLLVNWPERRLSAKEIRVSEQAAARTGRPLAVVLREAYPERLACLLPSDAAVWGEANAGDAVSTIIAAYGAVAAYASTGRATKAEQLADLPRRVREWESGRRDRSLRAFMEDVATRGAGDEVDDAPVWLSTVHGVKGLEAPTVAVVGLHERGFDGGPNDSAEERRLFYVAATRARDHLILTHNTENGMLLPGRYVRELEPLIGGLDDE